MDSHNPPCLEKLVAIPGLDDILRAQLKERAIESNVGNAVVQVDLNGNLVGVICRCTTEFCKCGLGNCMNATTSGPSKSDYTHWGKRPYGELTEEEERRIDQFLKDPPKRARLDD